jgi:hypothetical protein
MPSSTARARPGLKTLQVDEDEYGSNVGMEQRRRARGPSRRAAHSLSRLAPERNPRFARVA